MTRRVPFLDMTITLRRRFPDTRELRRAREAEDEARGQDRLVTVPREEQFRARDVLGSDVRLIDSAEETAAEAARTLDAARLGADADAEPSYRLEYSEILEREAAHLGLA